MIELQGEIEYRFSDINLLSAAMKAKKFRIIIS